MTDPSDYDPNYYERPKRVPYRTVEVRPDPKPGLFSTNDLPFAAFLAVRGLALSRVTGTPERRYFEFADPESQVEQLKIAWFNSSELAYSERLRLLKSLLQREPVR